MPPFYEPTFRCVTCEAAAPRPTFHVGLPFCCAGCVADGPCICSYDEPATDAEHETSTIDVEVPLAAVS